MAVLSQELLQEELSARLSDIQSVDLSEGDATDPGELAVFVVVREVDMRAFLRSAIDFASQIPPDLAQAWYRSFTRTIFLAGDPSRIRERHRPGHVSADGMLAWFGPLRPESYQGLRRLLKIFDAPAMPALPDGIAVGASNRATRWRLYVDTAAIGMDEYLVHVHHLVCEATIRGLIGLEDRIEVRNLERIESSTGPFAYTRVAADGGDDTRLRLYAGLVDCRQ
jgi:hypothetical protein